MWILSNGQKGVTLVMESTSLFVQKPMGQKDSTCQSTVFENSVNLSSWVYIFRCFTSYLKPDVHSMNYDTI